MIYTKKDFDSFEIKDGRVICPSGDYTQIKAFPEHCSFGECCIFGEWCSFGEWCTFGKHCTFGECCSFGKWCNFSECCSFSERCNFSERCDFGEHCRCESDKEFVRMVSFEGTGSERRKTYCFLLTDGTIYVRCGCFAGTEQAFLDKVAKTHGETHHGKAYRMFFAAAKFELTEE